MIKFKGDTMSNKNPTYKFQKGHKPVSPGRPKLPADIREARNVSYEEMCRTVIEVRNMTPAELKQVDLENIPFGKRAIINAYAKFDYHGIQQFENRLWGKAQETVNMKLEKNENTLNVELLLKDLPDEYIIKLAERIDGMGDKEQEGN